MELSDVLSQKSSSSFGIEELRALALKIARQLGEGGNLSQLPFVPAGASGNRLPTKEEMAQHFSAYSRGYYVLLPRSGSDRAENGPDAELPKVQVWLACCRTSSQPLMLLDLAFEERDGEYVLLRGGEFQFSEDVLERHFSGSAEKAAELLRSNLIPSSQLTPCDDTEL